MIECQFAIVPKHNVKQPIDARIIGSSWTVKTNTKKSKIQQLISRNYGRRFGEVIIQRGICK